MIREVVEHRAWICSVKGWLPLCGAESLVEGYLHCAGRNVSQ